MRHGGSPPPSPHSPARPTRAPAICRRGRGRRATACHATCSCRFTGERKPIYADLTSLASVDLIARSLRRACRNADADATVTVTEMLPAPDQAWLTDARGQRYTAELRMVALDQKMANQKQEG